MSYSSEMYDLWRKARIKFIKDNPATARALGLTVPSMTDALIAELNRYAP